MNVAKGDCRTPRSRGRATGGLLVAASKRRRTLRLGVGPATEPFRTLSRSYLAAAPTHGADLGLREFQGHVFWLHGLTSANSHHGSGSWSRIFCAEKPCHLRRSRRSGRKYLHIVTVTSG